MFLEPLRFRANSQLLAGFEIARRELDKLTRDEFCPWPQAGAYEGAWLLFPLWLHEPPTDLAIDFAANQRRCPELTAYLRSLDGILSACFSWLDPGSHIMAHIDAYYPNVIRAHLGLKVPASSMLRVAEAQQELQERQVVMIDGQVEHEVANLSKSPRVTLLIDAEMSPDEAQYVMAHSPARRAQFEQQQG